MYTVMEALWWAGCTYGSFKVLQWCNCFPPASIFDVQHVAGNSLDASGALIFSSHSCQKAWWHNVSSKKSHLHTSESIYVCFCLLVYSNVCLSLSVLPLSTATCRAQQHYPSFQIHSNPNRSKHCTPSNPVKSLFTDDPVWRQQAAGLGDGEGEREKKERG